MHFPVLLRDRKPLLLTCFTQIREEPIFLFTASPWRIQKNPELGFSSAKNISHEDTQKHPKKAGVARLQAIHGYTLHPRIARIVSRTAEQGASKGRMIRRSRKDGEGCVEASSRAFVVIFLLLDQVPDWIQRSRYQGAKSPMPSPNTTSSP